MSLIDRLIPSRQAVSTLVHGPVQLGIASPWSTSHLARIAVADTLGIVPGLMTRQTAMKVPAVARGRGLIVGHLARFPLLLWDDATKALGTTPAWLSSTATPQTPLHRMAWTLDDLIFSGLSLWAVDREDGDGPITDAIRVHPSDWHVDPDMRVSVRGTPVTKREVILFEGLQEGLCTIAAEEMRGALDMSAAWRQRVAAPIPNVSLSQTEANVQLTDDEIDDLVLDWEKARAAGGTAFIPYGIKAEALGQVVADLYVAGRNAGRLDIANILQCPASLLEGSQSTATLTYSTREGERNDFADQTLTYWGSPVESRLSQDDVTPEGTAIRFDFSSIATPLQPTQTPITED